MSDGGAAVIVEGLKVGAQGLKMAAQVRIGRIVLWVGAALLGVMALAAHPGSRALYVIGALVFVVAATIGAIQARRRNKRGAVAGMVIRVALAAFSLGIVAFLLWLKGRRGKAEALPPPPSPEEIDRLASLELEKERAA